MKNFVTSRKRAQGLGSAKSGTEHFWQQTVLGSALLILTPIFIFMVGSQLGRDHGDVVAYFSRPLPAIIVALTFIVGFIHYKNGVQVLIEDYVHGLTRKVLIIVMNCISYAAITSAIYALVVIAL